MRSVGAGEDAWQESDTFAKRVGFFKAGDGPKKGRKRRRKWLRLIKRMARGARNDHFPDWDQNCNIMLVREIRAGHRRRDVMPRGFVSGVINLRGRVPIIDFAAPARLPADEPTTRHAISGRPASQSDIAFMVEGVSDLTSARISSSRRPSRPQMAEGLRKRKCRDDGA